MYFLEIKESKPGQTAIVSVDGQTRRISIVAVNDALLVANLRRKTAIDWERRPTLFTLFPGNKFIRTKMRLKEGTTIESQREICLILFTSDVV